MIRTLGHFIFTTATLLALTSAAQAQVKVTFDHNPNASATSAFKFKNVPSPAKDDAAARAKLLLIEGQADGNGADLSALTDGALPTEEDQPAANFFWNAGTGGGRFQMDLGSVIEIAQVNTYSWHPNTRGPQVYRLWASDGADPGFNPAPKTNVDLAKNGWKLITVVDTRSKDGDDGGQFGVSITDSRGSLGKFRYLLFDCYVTETGDEFGNTFYSEIDVIAKK
ncbi:MAG TPA: hypothetical protein VK582_02020 [Pyrinomonadaceae bacterium]|nr:hypothetical protein [Pyrinomonadaceae bacterium]